MDKERQPSMHSNAHSVLRDDVDVEDEIIDPQTRLYKKRYGMLVLYFLMNLVMSSFWGTISTVNQPMEAILHESDHLVVWLTSIFYILYVPGTFWASFSFERFGCRRSLILAGSLLVVGSWLRLVSVHIGSYALAMFASVLGGLAQPTVLNACAAISAAWLGDKERTIGTMFGETIPANLGAAITSELAKGMIPAGIKMQSVLEYNTMTFFVVLGIFNTLVWLLFSILFRSKPPVPPSFAAAADKAGFLESCRMMKDPNFVCLMILYGFNFSVICIVPAVLNTMLRSYGYEQTNTMLTIFLVTGILGALVCGPATDYFRKYTLRIYKIMLILLSLLSCGGMLGFTLFLGPDQTLALSLSLAAVSLAATGMVPVGIEAAAEIVFPYSEGTAAGFLIMFGNLWGFVGVEIVMAVRYPCANGVAKCYDYTPSVWFLTGMLAAAVVLAVFFNGRYRRAEAEEQEARNQAGLDSDEKFPQDHETHRRRASTVLTTFSTSLLEGLIEVPPEHVGASLTTNGEAKARP